MLAAVSRILSPQGNKILSGEAIAADFDQVMLSCPMDKFAAHKARWRALYRVEVPEGGVSALRELEHSQMPEIRRMLLALRNEPALVDEHRAFLAEAEALVASGEPGLALLAIAKLLYGAAPF